MRHVSWVERSYYVNEQILITAFTRCTWKVYQDVINRAANILKNFNLIILAINDHQLFFIIPKDRFDRSTMVLDSPPIFIDTAALSFSGGDGSG